MALEVQIFSLLPIFIKKVIFNVPTNKLYSLTSSKKCGIIHYDKTAKGNDKPTEGK